METISITYYKSKYSLFINAEELSPRSTSSRIYPKEISYTSITTQNQRQNSSLQLVDMRLPSTKSKY